MWISAAAKVISAVAPASSTELLGFIDLYFMAVILKWLSWLSGLLLPFCAIGLLVSLFTAFPAWLRLRRFKKFINAKVEESSEWQALDKGDRELFRDSFYDDFWYEYRDRYS
ncbi:MAG: hypothetical protein HC847_20270 [Hydrococcus sp. RU_2_2]|nr:hypothetical protein [Hydrococcus sp. RU_2_2]NJP20970.1 hypothetical protein [Hydrococcus sp. CRU_1_1]